MGLSRALRGDADDVYDDGQKISMFKQIIQACALGTRAQEAVQSPLFGIEEVWGLPCGALDLKLGAVEDAAREMYSTLRTKWLASCTLSSTSDRWQACQHGIRSRRRAVTD